jgi:hypothetical protein
MENSEQGVLRDAMKRPGAVDWSASGLGTRLWLTEGAGNLFRSTELGQGTHDWSAWYCPPKPLGTLDWQQQCASI